MVYTSFIFIFYLYFILSSFFIYLIAILTNLTAWIANGLTQSLKVVEAFLNTQIF
jgi:hypothetical protein